MGVDAWALVTLEEGGVGFVRVAELDGVLVDCATGRPIDLVSLVWVDAVALGDLVTSGA